MQSKFAFLPLHKLGAREDKQNPGVINFGLFLPGVSAAEDNKLWVKVIHEKDQFLQDILPMNSKWNIRKVQNAGITGLQR